MRRNRQATEPPRARQRGVALITAILIVALATVAAAALLSDANTALRRAQMLQDSEMAWWYGKGLDTWAAGLLRRPETNGNQPQTPVDSLGDPWANPVPDLPFEHGVARGRIIDLQGLFNLNNLAAPSSKAALAQFGRLVALVTGDSNVPTDLGISVRQWMLPPSATASLAPVADYTSLVPPYQAAGVPMYSASELLQIAGMTPQIYEALRPYVTAIPPASPAPYGPPAPAQSQARTQPAPSVTNAISAPYTDPNSVNGIAGPGGGTQMGATTLNVNTAPLPVLLSLSENPDAGRMKSFVKERVEHPAQTAQEAMQRLGLSGNDVTTGALGVGSRFYEMRAEIAVGNDRLTFYSLILRPDKGPPVVLARSSTTD